MLLQSGVAGLISTDAEVELLNAFFSVTKIYQVFVPTKRIQGGEDQPVWGLGG